MRPLLKEVWSGAEPDFAAFSRALGDALPLLAELPRTPQEPDWHGEGDVGVHTNLVLGEAYRLGGELEARERFILVLAALLHDIGKALTTRTDSQTGRIVSPRHADRGRSYLAHRLPELGLPYDVIHAVMALVGHHHDLGRTLNDASERAFRRLARQADVRLLCLLEVADVRGRIAPDQDSKLLDLELFELASREFGVWEGDPYGEFRAEIADQLGGFAPEYRDLVLGQGLLDFEAGLISTPHEAVARGYAARRGFPELVVTCGPSGSGKSAWVADTLPGFDVVSLDLLREEFAGKRADQGLNGRVLQEAKERLRISLRAKRRVVWDATNTRRDFRGVPLRLGLEYGALTTLAVFQPPLGTIFERNPARAHAVPAHVVANQVEHAEFPHLPEAHRTFILDEFLRRALGGVGSLNP